jgi:hypothetical protein
MSDYRCTCSFKSTTHGNSFWQGQEISASNYNRLNAADKKNFTKASSSAASGDSWPPSQPSDTSSSYMDFGSNSDSSSSDTSSFDFGGGDAGGGGSTGDW